MLIGSHYTDGGTELREFHCLRHASRWQAWGVKPDGQASSTRLLTPTRLSLNKLEEFAGVITRVLKQHLMYAQPESSCLFICIHPSVQCQASLP